MLETHVIVKNRKTWKVFILSLILAVGMCLAAVAAAYMLFEPNVRVIVIEAIPILCVGIGVKFFLVKSK
jgi:hypothetical protein